MSNPVAWINPDEQDARKAFHWVESEKFTSAVYTAPPQRKPLVWLSEEDEQQIKHHCTTVACVLRAVKAKLKEKNT